MSYIEETALHLQTKIDPKPSKYKIQLKDSLFTIGSCFSQVMGVYLRQNKFNVSINPFGTVYNPQSIFKLLQMTIDRSLPDPNGFVKQGEVHLHHDFHSDLSELSKDKLKKSIDRKINNAHDFVRKVDWLVITFGSAIIYRMKGNGEVVANCHKVPQKEFDKEILKTEKIIGGFEEVRPSLSALNPELRIVLTVSPVRHVKDGLQDNSYSKSILRVCCQELASAYPNVSYFPSYEIMIDDLRDYRYYGHDLIHPNELAESYIWDVFKKTYLAEEDLILLEKWEKLRKALDHRPRHPETLEYKLFLKNTLDKMEELSDSIDIKGEIAQVKSILQQN